MRSKLARLRRMDAAELGWRGRAAARLIVDHAWTSLVGSRWDRKKLRHALASNADMAGVHTALAANRWDEAHRELSRVFTHRAPRFIISPQHRALTADRIRTAFPDAATGARRHADRLLAGEYDLLGYRALRFGGEWHYDPVHNRRVPRQFWSTVPYLDASCGDHKIIWELNRHQSWLTLGRAYWLTADRRYRDRFCLELAGWMDANPPLIGINWASMLELGLRSISWLWALNFFVEGNGVDGTDAWVGETSDATPWTVDLLLGLDRQLTHIELNLSYYFSPNTHLLGEALALYVCGRALPELLASERREHVGRRILIGEIQRQIASDGGHCERSTHYHHYALDFYLTALTIARITEDPIAPVFEQAAGRLAAAARLLADDRGRTPHIGDDDGGALFPIAERARDDWRDSLTIAAGLLDRPDLRVDRTPEEAYWMLAHPKFNRDAGGWDKQPAQEAPLGASLGSLLGSARLLETGYCVSRSAAGEHLVIDGGPHGYQNGGHAHADALSLTLSIRGLPLLVDPGTGCYTADVTLRDRFRATASHNTLVLDDRWQSVPEGPFHWTSTTDAVIHRWRSASGFDYFDGAHGGYAPAEHRRRVLALHGDLLVVADLVTERLNRPRGPHRAAVHWHIDPGWRVDLRGGAATFNSGDKQVRLIVPGRRLSRHVGDDETGLGWYSPVYGRIEPTTTLRVCHEAEAPFWIVSVFDLNPLDPVEEVDWVPIWSEAGVMAHGTAVKISRSGSVDFVLFAEPSPGGADGTWRLGEVETDARMLLCRVARSGELTRLALVDASVVRGAGRRALNLSLGRVTPSLYIDEASLRKCTPCAASPGS